MLDATPLLFNNTAQSISLNPKEKMKLRRRSDVPSGVTYHIVDFNYARDLTPDPGLVSQYRDENCLMKLLVPTDYDEELDAPELLWDVRVNCYEVDVYCLGKVFENYLVKVSITYKIS